MTPRSPMARAMRPVADVSVRRDFEVEQLSGRWVPERVPIVINNFNRLTYLRRLVDSMRARGYENLYVIDNASTYQPLMDYYREAGLRVFYLDRNVGYLALWTTPIGALFVDDYYVYTDSDIEPAAECPDDFISHFRAGLDGHSRIDKVGFGLKTDDLPDAYAMKQRVIEHEAQFRPRGAAREFHRAAIDTTFALYRPGAAGGSWLRALRTGEPYLARHLPWYEDTAHPDEEQSFYLETIGTSTHWSLRGGDAADGTLTIPLWGEPVRVTGGRHDDLWNQVSRGEWKPEAYDLIDRFVDARHSYLEVGSGPGATALYAARTACHVYALEPDPERRAELEGNFRLNPDTAGVVSVHDLRVPGTPDALAVPSFEQFLGANDLADCSLVSLDLDGRESRELPEMLNFLRRARPTVLVTLRPGRRFGITTASAAGKAAIAVLGVLTGLSARMRLGFYKHVYDGQGEKLTLWRLLRTVRSRVTIVATDEEW